MAETEKSEQPQTNGLENGLDEDERSKLRPADIDADVKEMERRKRVEMIMNSKLFREELERIIELQMKDGNGPAGLLQQISDMMGIQSGKLHTTHMFRGPNCLTPINDIRGVESMGYEKGEKNLRCKLASVFRLMDLYGWSQGINNQITARLNQDEEHFLVNPHGMLYNEITASSLVKVDMQGNIVEPGTTNFSVNTQGFLLHSAIHAARPDVNCVIHIKTPSVLAVSSLKCGLLPVCQEALVIGEVSQHPFVSGIFEPEEREKIIRNLGPHNKVLLLHNHGAVCCGATVEEAFYNVYNTVLACETQMKLMPMGVDNLLLVSDETRKQVYDAAHRAPDVGAPGEKKPKQFRVGEMEFEALIRMLDNAGFRTGYIYRHPLVKCELPKPKNDVEVPPAVSSLGYLIEQEELYKQGNWKKYIDGRNRLDRTKWLNSPNVYQKVEILETGTSDPKKITKWVAESSPTHSSTPVKIESALQFVPKGTNPKEFKKLQQQIKENRRADKITSGPQSHILEGVSWEDAKKLQDANITQTGDQVILVGAASKGIIQRNYQHNALVYKTPYAKNPFDSMSDKEIEDYKQLVERKQRGDTDYEESQSESEAISSSRQDALRHFKSPLLSPQSATSETEEESRDEPRVLRIETKTAPRPIQAEVVLSDVESDSTDARVERSHSARYPKAEKPESVTLMNSFRKSWSLKREKDKSKDVESRTVVSDYEQDRMESLHCCVARIKQLTYKPVIIDVGTKPLRPLLKSISDPCNLSTLVDDPVHGGDDRTRNADSSRGIIASDLQHRLNVRKKSIYSAKMKFLGLHKGASETRSEPTEKTSTSPMCALISEIRETISDIMSPERKKPPEGYFDSMRWIERPKFVPRTGDSGGELKSKVSLGKSFSGLTGREFNAEEDFEKDFQLLPEENPSCTCAGNTSEDAKTKPKVDENQNDVMKVVQVSDEEATYTVTDDSLLQTYSFTETTETEWYYNKTIMKLENSQTVLEIKEGVKKELEAPAVKYIDTGIDTDFTSEKENENENEIREEEEETEKEKEKEKDGDDQVEATEDIDADAPVCESSGLNKSSETDSSLLKTSSGRTSNDVDTSFAFKTETENSDKTQSPEGSKKKFLSEMLEKTKEPIEEESSDSGETNLELSKQESEGFPQKLPGIPESPEFTNVDTEDAPATSSSKDTSPENEGNGARLTEDELLETSKEPDVNVEKENAKAETKRKKGMKSSTRITVKKEMKEKDSDEAVVSEIRLTIKNLNPCQSNKYEVKIQDVTNTSEELSRSVSSAGETFESFEIVESSCDCDAQQNLEELQGEVSTTIEKLQTIENYFEDEIKKHSGTGNKNASDESTIEYRYRELEEVMNESKDEVGVEGHHWNEYPEAGPGEENAEYFVSGLWDICGEVEVGESTLDEIEKFGGGDSGVESFIRDSILNLTLNLALEEEGAFGTPEGKLEEDKEKNITDGKEFIEEDESLLIGNISPIRKENTVSVFDGVAEEEETIGNRSDMNADGRNELKEVISKDDLGNEELEVIENPENEKELEEETADNFMENKLTKGEEIAEGEQPDKSHQPSIYAEVQEAETIGEATNTPEGENIGEEIITLETNTEIVMDEKEAEVDDTKEEERNQMKKTEDEVPSVVFLVTESAVEDINKSQVENAGEEITTKMVTSEIVLDKKEEDSDVTQEVSNAERKTDGEVEPYSPSIVMVKQTESLEEDTKENPEEEIATKLETSEIVMDKKDAEVEDTNTVKKEEGRNPERKMEGEVEPVLPSVEVEEAIEREDVEDTNRSKGENPGEEITTEMDTSEIIMDNKEPELENTSTDLKEEDRNSERKMEGEVESDLPPVGFMIKETETIGEDANTLEGENIGEEITLETNTSEIVMDKQEAELEDTKEEGHPERKTKSEEEPDLAAVQEETIREATNPLEGKNPGEGITPKMDIFEIVVDKKEAEVEDVNPDTTEETNPERKTEGLSQEESEEIIQQIAMVALTLALNSGEELEEVDQTAETAVPTVGGSTQPETLEPEVDQQSMRELREFLSSRMSTSLKAISWLPRETTRESRRAVCDPVDYVLNFLLNTAVKEKSGAESPTNSLAEFEDMENIISTSSFVIDSLESQLEGDVESLPEEEEAKDWEGRRGDPIFKVTIATPTKKEIFINYSMDCSSSFNISSEFVEELCNSYVKTDDVNEDFENLSSDNPDFFSVGSPGKNSPLDSSFCSTSSTLNVEPQFCCLNCDTPGKSPRSLAIIQEVDEGDSSTSSEPIAPQ